MGLFSKKKRREEKLYLRPSDAFELKQRRIEDKQRKQEAELRSRRDAESKNARFNRGASKIAKLFSNPVRGFYSQPSQGYTNTRSPLQSGRRPGRPRGTYDSRYAAYGGVYGYRKILNARLRGQRLQQLRDASVSPRQQQVLAQIEARDRMREEAPENQVIPDTTGKIGLRSIHDEIEDASNIFP